MDIEKQKLVLGALLSSRDLMALCSPVLRHSYFDIELKKTVKFIVDYFQQYKDVPKQATVRAETGVEIEDLGSISRADLSYIASEIETFCQNRAMTEAILAGPALLQKGDYGQILQAMKDAIAVGLQKDMGTDYFSNPEERLRLMSQEHAKISTGLPELDAAIGGGVGRQELLMFAANSGGGKSMTMLNIAKNFLAQGLNGVYISLEMAEHIVSKRLDSMITHVSQDNILAQASRVAQLIENSAEGMGKFIIKRMPENRTTAATIRSYLQQLEQASGFRPDFIVVDYIDIMGTTMNISMDNLFTKDKFVTEEVRSLGFDFNAVIISASQLGRGALEADKLSQAHIQGGISKINTSDYTIGIKQDDVMRSAGEIYFEILKSRNSSGVGRRILLGWDSVSLNIQSLQKKSDSLNLVKKSKSAVLGTADTVFGKNSPGSDGVLGLLNS